MSDAPLDSPRRTPMHGFKGERVLMRIHIGEQDKHKGVPLYQGPNTAANFGRFWSWPFWDMNSYYFHSTTGTGEKPSHNCWVPIAQSRTVVIVRCLINSFVVERFAF